MTGTIKFVVDAKLLRELGSRLVGRPHIALAELIKNSYDADATVVTIDISDTEIVVADNGHGMSYDDLVNRWMRIGTGEKESEKYSPWYGRPLTGSKGVGRLSVQILADRLTLQSVTRDAPSDSFTARVNWAEALKADTLNEAIALVDRGTPRDFELPLGSEHGTRIVLTGLQQTWDGRALLDLAREIWPLQPPFKSDRRSSQRSGFTVELHTGNPDQDRKFSEQMDAVLSLWTAKLVGKTLPSDRGSPTDAVRVRRPKVGDDTAHVGAAWKTQAHDIGDEAADLQTASPPDAPGWPRTVQLAIEFAGGEREIVNYRLDDSSLDRVRFEIRVFNLKNRQPSGISVADARAYLRRFGGIHVYDAGFHLPYYGPDGDWLHIEMDHSHRVSQSALLPTELSADSNVANPLQYLPTNSRLFGQVQIDTQREARFAASIGPGAVREALTITITRDRLRDTQAYRSLVQIVRFAIDLYAIREAQQALERKLSQRREKNSDSESSPGSEDRLSQPLKIVPSWSRNCWKSPRRHCPRGRERCSARRSRRLLRRLQSNASGRRHNWACWAL